MNNGLCFVGPHRKFNPFSNQYHELIPGQGHFGPDAIPGVSIALTLTLSLSPYTFTTQPRLWSHGVYLHTNRMCTNHTRAGGALFQP